MKYLLISLDSYEDLDGKDTCQYRISILFFAKCYNYLSYKHGRRSRGRPAATLVDQLEEDTGLFKQDLLAIMADRGKGANSISAGALEIDSQNNQAIRSTSSLAG